MKVILREILVTFIGILFVTYFIRSVDLQNQIPPLLTASLCLSILNVFLKPLLKVILIPLNVVTLGLIGWFINVILLYLTTLLVTGFTVIPFTFSAFNTTISFSYFFSLIITAFCINLVSRFLDWIIS